jgi:hypothetical protein
MTLLCYSIFADEFGQANSAENYKDAVNCLLALRSARRSIKPKFSDNVCAVQDLK